MEGSYSGSGSVEWGASGKWTTDTGCFCQLYSVGLEFDAGRMVRQRYR